MPASSEAVAMAHGSTGLSDASHGTPSTTSRTSSPPSGSPVSSVQTGIERNSSTAVQSTVTAMTSSARSGKAMNT